MPHDIEFINRPKYFEVIYRGKRSFDDFNALIEKGYNVCQKNNCNKILLDLCEAKGKWSEIDRFRIGEKASQVFKFSFKIVVIDKKEIINKFGENTAINRGLNVLITSNRNEGLDWLLKEPE